MYNIKRVNGKYLAINDKIINDVYVVPDDVFEKMVRAGINRNNIADDVFFRIKQKESGVFLLKQPVKNPFDKLNKEQLGESKIVLKGSKKGIEKLGKSQKKVNRKRSIKLKQMKIRVAAGVMAVVMAWSGIGLIKKRINKDSNNTYTIEHSIDSKENKNKVIEDSNDDNNYQKYTKNETLDFYYEEYSNASEESAKNAMQYLDLCKKYGSMYGEDYRLLIGTLAQELNGIHKLELDTPAIGVSQIEKKEWVNTKVRAYNHELNKDEEKWLIAPNAEDTIDDDEFNKRLKSDDIIAKYGIDNTINIETVEGSIKARAMIDAFNREQAYKNGATKKIPESDFMAYTKARENKGPIVYKTLDFGDEWKYHLDVTNNGDDNYVNEIFTYAGTVSDYCQDNEPYVTRVFDGEKIIVFSVNAISSNQLARAK